MDVTNAITRRVYQRKIHAQSGKSRVPGTVRGRVRRALVKPVRVARPGGMDSVAEGSTT
jgi:hypothetical protein